MAADSVETIDFKNIYIFTKQLEEADFIIINKIDSISDGELSALRNLAKSLNPDASVLAVSAKTGQGFQDLINIIANGCLVGRNLAVDYDLYAEGEASLGWLNSRINVHSDNSVELDQLVLAITRCYADKLKECEGEICHLKVSGTSGSFYSVANVVDRRDEAALSICCNETTAKATIVVNARVAIDPEVLQRMMMLVVEESCRAFGVSHEVKLTRSFRPGRPIPTYRYA